MRWPPGDRHLESCCLLRMAFPHCIPLHLQHEGGDQCGWSWSLIMVNMLIAEDGWPIAVELTNHVESGDQNVESGDQNGDEPEDLPGLLLEGLIQKGRLLQEGHSSQKYHLHQTKAPYIKQRHHTNNQHNHNRRLSEMWQLSPSHCLQLSPVAL